jgi:hypothetical protein
MDAFESQKPLPCSISVASAREWTPPVNTCFKDALLANGYVIDTSDENAYVPFSELKGVLVNSRAVGGMSDTAIGRELGRLGVVSHDMKISGKTVKVRKYIRKLVEEE